MRNKQVGPGWSADILSDVVARTTYKPGWRLELQEIDRGQGCQGLTLMISAKVPDTCVPGESVTFMHLMPVPPAAYDEWSWKRWVFNQCVLVEYHESLEWFRIDDVQVYFPGHAPGRDPYALADVVTEEAAFAPAVPWYGGDCKDEHFND